MGGIGGGGVNYGGNAKSGPDANGMKWDQDKWLVEQN